MGNSLYSEAISIRAAEVPDAPLLLQNVAEQTTASQIGVQWNEGAYNGGSQVLDYELSYAVAQLTENSPIIDPLVYSVYDSSVSSTDLIVLSLSAGQVYSIRVRARNLVGYSGYSAPVSILAAQVPDAPENIANDPDVTNNVQIGIKWQPPTFDGGSALIDYSVWSD